MQFLFPTLTWGFLLVLLPVLIHLINRLRHQRVQWAAMQFLMASYRKHQRWVWLKQLLLLATTAARMSMRVAMLAHLVTQDQWLSWFGGQTTHHVVLLDDSLSMGDRSQGGVSAFDRARDALRQLLQAAQQSGQPQKLTLLRYSRAARAAHMTATPASSSTEAPAVESLSALADCVAVPVRAGLEETLFGERSSSAGALEPTELVVGVEPALDVVNQLLGPSPKDRCVLHLLSDFRQHEWEKPDALRERLQRLTKHRTEIHFIRCAVDPDLNLGIVSLQPEVGTQAAGVPLFMNVRVKNFGQTAVERVSLKVRSVQYPTDPSGAESPAQPSELPVVILDRLEPGETISRQFQVFFTTPGHHVVEAELPNDALNGDNRRWCVLPLTSSERALVIDGDPTGKAAFYLETIFQPGSRAKTGVAPSVQPISYLRDVTAEELKSYQAIYLLNPPPLDATSEANLLAYLQQGGGVATFLGPQQNGGFLTQAYEKGWFPAPVDRLLQVSADSSSDSGRLQFDSHPIFRALAGQQNPFAASIRVQQYVGVQAGWEPGADSTTRTIAKLHDGAPLVLERSVGAGRSIAFLTSLSPDWNNWAMEPSFVVVALQLHAYLTATQRPTTDLFVGQPLRWQVDAAEYRPEVTITAAATSENVREWTKTASPLRQDQPLRLLASLGEGMPAGIERGETELAGIYDAKLDTLTGSTHHRRSALNVSTQDSDLALSETAGLRQALAPVKVDIRSVEQGMNLASLGESNAWSHWLLGLSVLLLLAEQWLAYRLSYHLSGWTKPEGVAT